MLKVKNNTNPNKLAGAIAATLREKKSVKLQCIGAAPVNQAIKAMIIANRFLTPGGMEIRIKPSFSTLEMEGEEKTCIRFYLDVGSNNDDN